MEKEVTSTEEAKPKKRPGRVAQGNDRYNVMLPADLADWAKHQPGGLSETVRSLLKEAHAKATLEATA